MVSKSIQALKKNPVLILFYAVYMIITVLILFTLYPRDLSQFTNIEAPADFNFMGYIITMVKLLAAVTLTFILGLLFTPGYGYMIAEAVINGKTSAKSFISGIEWFFVRILLTMLLLIAFAIAFGFAISIVSIPFTIMMALRGTSLILTLMISFVSMVVVILAVPFILLWIPSIFIDNTGVIQGLKNGARAGLKNYWKLVLTLAVIYIPIIINMLFNFDSMTEGVIFTPAYVIIMILEAIFSIVIFPLLFIIYLEWKQRQSIG